MRKVTRVCYILRTKNRSANVLLEWHLRTPPPSILLNLKCYLRFSSFGHDMPWNSLLKSGSYSETRKAPGVLNSAVMPYLLSPHLPPWQYDSSIALWLPTPFPIQADNQVLSAWQRPWLAGAILWPQHDSFTLCLRQFSITEYVAVLSVTAQKF